MVSKLMEKIFFILLILLIYSLNPLVYLSSVHMLFFTLNGNVEKNLWLKTFLYHEIVSKVLCSSSLNTLGRLGYALVVYCCHIVLCILNLVTNIAPEK